MRKQENQKNQLREQLYSIGAVLMSLVGLMLALYLVTIVVRALSTFVA